MAIKVKFDAGQMKAALKKARAKGTLREAIHRGCRIGAEDYRLSLFSLGDSPSSRLRLARGLVTQRDAFLAKINAIRTGWRVK